LTHLAFALVSCVAQSRLSDPKNPLTTRGAAAYFTEMIGEDADLRSSLAALGLAALRQLHDVLTWPEPSRDALLRSLGGRTELSRSCS
jgi:hypothetical protein